MVIVREDRESSLFFEFISLPFVLLYLIVRVISKAVTRSIEEARKKGRSEDE